MAIAPDCCSSIAVLQRGYKAWLRRIYAAVNPYTGVPLAKDPAVAIIQIQNEDSLLFWTMQGIKGTAYKELCKLYGDWALKKVRINGKDARSMATAVRTPMMISTRAWRGYLSSGSSPRTPGTRRVMATVGLPDWPTRRNSSDG